MAKRQELSLRLEYQGRILHEIRGADMPPTLLIGRSQKCAWAVPDGCTSVSGRHAMLVLRRSSVVVKDLESRNGIYCAGRRVSQQKVDAGDVFSIGDCKLIVERDFSSAGKAMEKYHVIEQLSGADRGRTVQLTKDTMRIGSDPKCEICISDQLVSHLHAVLELKSDGSCWVRDCGSRNGTKVNGVILADDAIKTGRMLQDGDIVSVAYVDYRFLDRRVVHVRSHFLRMAAVVFLTLSCALGAYFAYTLASPSAKTMRIEAERYAAKEQFDLAQEQLRQASDARGHANDVERRLELVQNVKLWKETFDAWNGIKEALASGKANLREVNTRFGPLISVNNDNWKWNATTAVAEMKDAQTTHGVIAHLLEAEEAFTAMEPDVGRLRKLLRGIDGVLSGCSHSPRPYQSKIVERLVALKAEIALTLSEYDDMQRAMQGFSSVDKADAVLSDLDRIVAGNAQRNTSRKKDGLPVSPLVHEQSKAFRAPVLALRDSYRRLRDNYMAVAKWSFSGFNPELPLPSAEDCISFPVLATRRRELIEANAALPGIIAQLKNFGFQFDGLGMKLDAEPPVCASLFDDNRLKAVYSCDSLDKPMPGYADEKASGVYDETVGVYVFFSYLNSLDGDFDSTIMDERFKPILFRAPEVFTLLESYRDFCFGKKDARLSAVMAEVRASVDADKGNKVLAWARYAEKQNSRRVAFVRQLVRTFASDKTRRGVIAGGMACQLRGRGCGFVPNDFNLQVNARFRELRREIGALLLSGNDKTPEEQSAAERKVLELGIPGDSYLKQAWVDCFKGGTEGEVAK